MMKEVQNSRLMKRNGPHVFWARFRSSVTAFIANRCIPMYKQKIYELGISAVQHRQKRNSLEKENKINREKAENIIKTDRLADLNVWEDCVPVVTEPAKVSNRETRVKTRQITKQLEEANKETEGAEFPLKVVKKVTADPRDASAEVSIYYTVCHIF